MIEGMKSHLRREDQFQRSLSVDIDMGPRFSEEFSASRDSVDSLNFDQSVYASL